MKREQKKKNITAIIDGLMILLNIATITTLLLYIVLPISKTTWAYGITLLADIIYLLLRGFSVIKSSRFLRIPTVILFNVLILYNYFNCTLRGDGDFVTNTEFLLLTFSFTLILVSIATRTISIEPSMESSVSSFSKGYIWLSMLSIFGVIITFVLLSAGFESGIPIESNLLSDNEEKGASYLWSFFSARIEIRNILQIRVPFFQDYGILTGLFHEPHILAYNIFPCIILLLGLTKGKLIHILLVVTAILFLLFCGSTANLIATAATLAVFAVLSFRKHSIAITIGIAILIYAVVSYIAYDDTLFQFVLGRLDEDNASNESSQNLLKFAFTPKSFFGTNMFSSNMMEGFFTNEDVGFIPFFMNIAFLLIYILNVIKLLFKNNPVAKSVGLASLYYLLHSAKMGMLMYKGFMPLLLVFMQTIVLDYYGRVRFIGKNISQGERIAA